MREPFSYRAKFGARRVFHLIYPWTALNGLDKKLADYLPDTGGVFIEAGANDGLRQSNTYYFEKRRSWTGLLVEPVPRLANRCRKVRRGSVVVEALLVAPADEGTSLEIYDLDLMTLVSSQPEGLIDPDEHAAVAETVQGISRKPLSVPGVTLSCLIEKHLDSKVDLLSLDVEGFELDVLRGLDLSRHRPRFILVETRVVARLTEHLQSHYELIDQLSHHDYLFRALHD